MTCVVCCVPVGVLIGSRSLKPTPRKQNRSLFRLKSLIWNPKRKKKLDDCGDCHTQLRWGFFCCSAGHNDSISNHYWWSVHCSYWTMCVSRGKQITIFLFNYCRMAEVKFLELLYKSNITPEVVPWYWTSSLYVRLLGDMIGGRSMAQTTQPKSQLQSLQTFVAIVVTSCWTTQAWHWKLMGNVMSTAVLDFVGSPVQLQTVCTSRGKKMIN